MTSWFLSSDEETQTFSGVQLSKINDSLSVSYRTGTDIVVILTIVVETKPDPENCKNCSSKCGYDCAELQYTIQHRTVLIIAPLTCSHLYTVNGPARQNPIQRTVRTAHLSVVMTVHNFSTQYSTEQF